MPRKKSDKAGGAGVAAESVCNSLSDLARAVGADRSTISRRVKRADWPVSRTPPYDADDVATVVDYLHAGDSDDPDDLKRAQAFKSRTLAARYLLDMARELGRTDRTVAELAINALDATSTLHFQQTRQRLGDFIAEHGGMDGPDADVAAEQFVREQFYPEFARILAAVIEFHVNDDPAVPALLRRIQRLTAELAVMPDIPPEMVEQIKSYLPE